MPTSILRALLVGAAPLALCTWSTTASALTIDGSTWSLSYGSCGTWNDPSLGMGVQLYDPLSSSASYGWNELTSGGDAWQQLSLAWQDGGTDVLIGGNDGVGSCDWTLDSEASTSTEALHLLVYGDVEILKYERVDLRWSLTSSGSVQDDGVALLVWFEVYNGGTTDLSSLSLLHAVDPQIDQPLTGETATTNDVQDATGSDGVDDWLVALGETGLTLGYAPCIPTDASLGFAERSDDPALILSDPDNLTEDLAGVVVLNLGDLAAGSATSAGFMVGLGTSETYTRSYTLADVAGSISGDPCGRCDADGDGFSSTDCGGLDCDDSDATVMPASDEVWYDGIDQDCDGASDYDADADGHDSLDYGGD
ncbi:MAG: hypothetical protein GXP62_02690, partial [Oligoflexia bacterium]|nr:hypothetical protein [Oligoflexia bacterium]